jgi:hypothetical protein
MQQLETQDGYECADGGWEKANATCSPTTRSVVIQTSVQTMLHTHACQVAALKSMVMVTQTHLNFIPTL